MKFFLLCLVVVLGASPAFSQAVLSNVYAYNSAPVVKYSGYQERTLLEGTTRDYAHLLVQAITLLPNQAEQPMQLLDEETALIIRSGELTLTLGGKRKTLKPGSLVMIMPGDEFRIANKAAQPLTYYQLRYTSNEMPDLDLYRLVGGSYWVEGQDIATNADHSGSNSQKEAYSSVMSNRIAVQINKSNPPAGIRSHRAAELIFVLDHSVQVQIDQAKKEALAGDVVFIESEVAHDIQTKASEGSTYLSFQL
ncbi:hypothetical protein GCM10028805_55480 [Spirosoma harenae]